MDSVKKTLENWLNELDNFSFKDYENLPEIDLYMDQVLTYLDRQFQIFQTSSLDKQITSSMINNYVKGEVLPAPINKKYNKEHISSIEEVITLKQVLSLAEVKQIEDIRYDGVVKRADTFNEFNKVNKEILDEAVKDTFEKLNKVKDNDKLALSKLAMEFALISNSYLHIAKRILFLIRVYEDLEKLNEAKEKVQQKKEEK